MTEGRYFVMVTVQKDDPDLDNPGRSAWVHETGSKKLRSVSVDKIPVTLEHLWKTKLVPWVDDQEDAAHKKTLN